MEVIGTSSVGFGSEVLKKKAPMKKSCEGFRCLVNRKKRAYFGSCCENKLKSKEKAEAAICSFGKLVFFQSTRSYSAPLMKRPTTSPNSSGAADSVTAVDDVNIPPLREKYDVFISFRGEDTRLTFTSHLHAALERKKIETYIDYKLNKGDEIGPTLLEAIEKSRLSVIIFSKNYASSTWCLIELVHILKCKKKNGQMVVPIFYDISPSDLRNQKGSFADAFAELENRFKEDKVMEWKAALVEATGLCGSDHSNTKG